jgi:hypothetical protein
LASSSFSGIAPASPDIGQSEANAATRFATCQIYHKIRNNELRCFDEIRAKNFANLPTAEIHSSGEAICAALSELLSMI